MNPAKKGENALGKGLDALIRKDNLERDEAIEETTTQTKTTNKSASKQLKKAKKAPKPKDDPNKIIIDGVVLKVRKNPRISLWSAKSAAVLRFLKNTTPAFSISKEASTLIEDAVKQKYPEIWEMFENEDF